jgi:hypothetical protein
MVLFFITHSIFFAFLFFLFPHFEQFFWFRSFILFKVVANTVWSLGGMGVKWDTSLALALSLSAVDDNADDDINAKAVADLKTLTYSSVNVCIVATNTFILLLSSQSLLLSLLVSL